MQLQNWHRNVHLGNVAMSEKLRSIIDESESTLDQLLNDEISQHVETLVEIMQ